MARSFRRKKGVTLVEMLVAAAVLGIGLAAGMSGLNSLNQISIATKGAEKKSTITTGLIENIRSNISRYQINFNHSGSTVNGAPLTEQILDEDNLGFVWSNSYYGDPAGCPSCTGRYDYVIQPLDGMPGLYKVTIRMINPAIFPGHKDYVFITGNK